MPEALPRQPLEQGSQTCGAPIRARANDYVNPPSHRHRSRRTPDRRKPQSTHGAHLAALCRPGCRPIAIAPIEPDLAIGMVPTFLEPWAAAGVVDQLGALVHPVEGVPGVRD